MALQRKRGASFDVTSDRACSVYSRLSSVSAYVAAMGKGQGFHTLFKSRRAAWDRLCNLQVLCYSCSLAWRLPFRRLHSSVCGNPSAVFKAALGTLR